MSDIDDDETAEFVENMMRQIISGHKPETVFECVAKALLKSDQENGHADEHAEVSSYMAPARAAIDAYHDYIRRHS